MAEPQVEDR